MVRVVSLSLETAISAYSRRDDHYAQILSVEDTVPYSLREGLLLLPKILIGDPFVTGVHNGEVIVRMTTDNGMYHYFNGPLEVEMDFIGFVLSNLCTYYLIREEHDQYFGYDSYPTDTKWNPVMSNYRHANYLRFCHQGTPQTLIFDGTQFIPGVLARGPWWTTSSCGLYVSVFLCYDADGIIYCSAVMPARKFINLFVPWWRGGPLFFGEPDPHKVPFVPEDFHGLMTDDLGIFADHIPLPAFRNNDHIIGCRDNIGPLPILEVQVDNGENHLVSFRRSKFLVVAYSRGVNVRAYDMRFTDFDCSIVEPFKPIYFPLEIAQNINSMIAAKGVLDPCLRLIAAIPPNRKMAPCGCSVFTSCSHADEVVSEHDLSVPGFHKDHGFLKEVGHSGDHVTIHMFPLPFRCFSGDLVDIEAPAGVPGWGNRMLCWDLDERIGRTVHVVRLLRDADDGQTNFSVFGLPSDGGYEIVPAPLTVVNYVPVLEDSVIRDFEVFYEHKDIWTAIKRKYGVKRLRWGNESDY